ncbi:MAG: cyclic lactone autoinducer peptide [Candidatus Gastranaerophilaceae bacterium]
MKSALLKVFNKFGAIFAAMALVVTTVNVNSCCFWITNQPELPANAKKLRKF